jgi:hypothetical protein
MVKQNGHFWLGLALVGTLTGCERSALSTTQGLGCGEGVRVVVAASPLCVYAPGIAVEACPEPVPERSGDGEGWTYCAIEPDLPPVVLGAAKSAALDILYADAGPPDALQGQEGGFGGNGGGGNGGGNAGRADSAPDFSRRDFGEDETVPDAAQADFDGGQNRPDAGELPDF